VAGFNFGGGAAVGSARSAAQQTVKPAVVRPAQAASVRVSKPMTAWDGGERRSPQRATNVSRLPAAGAAAPTAATGTHNEWESF